MYVIVHEWGRGDRSVTFGVMATVTEESGEAGELQYLYPHCFILMSVHRRANSTENPNSHEPITILFVILSLVPLHTLFKNRLRLVSVKMGVTF